MKKEELWKVYVAKNPRFEDDDAQILISGRGIKKLFNQTYDAAHDQGFRNGKAHAEMNAPKDPFGFGKIFG